MSFHVPPFQTEIARGYVTGSTDDNPYAIYLKKGHNTLRAAGIKAQGDDLAFLAYLVWSGLSAEWHSRDGDLTEDYLIVGEVSDQVSDREAELLVEIEPALRARVDERATAGSMTPEATALHDLLLHVAAVIGDRWSENDPA